jgi:hypothetical protein
MASFLCFVDSSAWSALHTLEFIYCCLLYDIDNKLEERVDEFLNELKWAESRVSIIASYEFFINVRP